MPSDMETQSYDARPLGEATSRFNGAPEISAQWVADHRGEFRLVDVREPHELSGPLGAVEGAENVPLQTLLRDGLATEEHEPIVLICRSGRRSALAAEALSKHGYDTVASVEGGMLAWNVQVLGHATAYEDEKLENASKLVDALDRTNGLPEVSATWVHEHLGSFRLIDVRQPAELVGPMGRIVQAQNVPLGDVMAASESWSRDEPIVLHCASGGRSGRAAIALERAGFTRVASMEGGMIAWRGFGLP